MAYVDTVNSMNPTHFWQLQTNSTDTGTGVTLNGTDTLMGYETTNIVNGYTTSASFNLDGYIDLDTSTDLDNMVMTKRTVSLWIKPTLDTLTFNIIKMGDDAEGMYINITAGMIPMIGIVSGSVGDVQYGTPLVINEPTHLLYEFDNGNMKLYQNNVLTVDYTSTIVKHGARSVLTNGIGRQRTVRVNSNTFQTYNLHAKLSMLAIWNSTLTAQQKSDLFTVGAQAVSRNLHFINLPGKTEVRVYDIDNSLAQLGGVEFVDAITGPDIIIPFDVVTTVDLRIALLNVENAYEPFNADITLAREDATYDASLILNKDRNYRNDGGWFQPIPITNITKPYLTGRTGDGETLTINPGVYTGSGVLTYSYQWYRDGVAISGETGLTYTLVASDIDLPLYCKETVDNVISQVSMVTNSRTWLNVKLYSIYENNVGGLIPSTSFTPVDFETEVTNINTTFSNSGGTYTLPAGDFLVIATMKYEDLSADRVCPEGRITYTGSGTDAPIYGSGYSRDANNRISWIRSTAYIANASAGDTVKFEHRSDTDLMTGGSVAGYCHIQIINMSTQALLFASDSADTGAYAGLTWNSIVWGNQDLVQGSTISKSGNQFTLQANRDYLISYGIAFANSSTARTQRVSKAVINGVDIPQSFSYAYMRQASDEFGDIGNMFMYKTGGSDEILELFSQRGDALQDGTTVRRVDTSSVFILDVTGANYYSAHDATGGQNVTVTTDLPLNLVGTEEVTTPDLTKTTDAKITCQTEGYWIMGSSAFVNNTAHSGLTRLTRGMKFRVAGADVAVGESGSYQRNDQSTSDTWDMAMGTLGVYHLMSGDEVEFVAFDAGQDGDANSYTVGNKCGFWALDINSI